MARHALPIAIFLLVAGMLCSHFHIYPLASQGLWQSAHFEPGDPPFMELTFLLLGVCIVRSRKSQPRSVEVRRWPPHRARAHRPHLCRVVLHRNHVRPASSLLLLCRHEARHQRPPETLAVSARMIPVPVAPAAPTIL
jgi:hypothetical protein